MTVQPPGSTSTSSFVTVDPCAKTNFGLSETVEPSGKTNLVLLETVEPYRETNLALLETVEPYRKTNWLLLETVEPCRKTNLVLLETVEPSPKQVTGRSRRSNRLPSALELSESVTAEIGCQSSIKSTKKSHTASNFRSLSCAETRSNRRHNVRVLEERLNPSEIVFASEARSDRQGNRVASEARSPP